MLSKAFIIFSAIAATSPAIAALPEPTKPKIKVERVKPETDLDQPFSFEISPYAPCLKRDDALQMFATQYNEHMVGSFELLGARMVVLMNYKKRTFTAFADIPADGQAPARLCVMFQGDKIELMLEGVKVPK